MAFLPTLASWTTRLEKYVLPILFVYVAWGQLQALRTPALLLAEQRAAGLGAGSLFAISVRHALILAFALFVALGLLSNRPPIRQPERLTEIVVPLLGTFLNYGFPLVDALPAPLRQSLMPAAWREGAAVVALAISTLGYALAAWSVVSLGRSFALLVSVRTIVRRGPYRWVRHPMYLGYLLLFAGIAIAAPSPGVIVLCAIYLVLTVWRAVLEERALARHSEQYRDYARRTGFLLPRLGISGG
jgi:protein-S-isoprenylcysteine O-methyltransferase Ste14